MGRFRVFGSDESLLVVITDSYAILYGMIVEKCMLNFSRIRFAFCVAELYISSFPSFNAVLSSGLQFECLPSIPLTKPHTFGGLPTVSKLDRCDLHDLFLLN